MFGASEIGCMSVFLSFLANTKIKPFASHMVALGGVHFCFHNHQPDTSTHCMITDMGLVHRLVCLFISQPELVYIY